MSSRNDIFSQIQQNISDLIANSPAADLEKNIKAFMGQTFNRMDLLTRDEFDTQIALLERALARVTALEQRVQELETKLAAQNTAPASDNNS
ncbi:accessory factor UbiK family protein [Paenalcaligenes hominis]|uniref:accessory factor UbiK family protein n=1 Tax=Paenalcaligenes hominis TaxID=643674 RepID=UPI00352657DB